MKDSGDSRTATTGDSDGLVHVRSGDHLAAVIASNRTVLVDFYADWCGPCQMLEPIVERLAAETPATVAKVDIDELRELARENEVQGVPTMLLYEDGELSERIVGLREEGTLRDLVTGS